MHYDAGRWHADRQFEILGTIDRPDRVLLNALGKLCVGSRHGPKHVPGTSRAAA